MKTLEVEPLVLDVRPIFQKGGSPCEVIDKAVAGLKPDQVFVLLVPFEPHPLFAKLGREGFSHISRQTEDGSWRIEFRKSGSPTNQEASRTSSCSQKKGAIHLDTRELEPPEPLVKTLESLDGLAKGSKLVMHSSSRPMRLFIQLDERGFTYDCSEQPDHSFITEIWHADEHSGCSSGAGH